MMPSVMLSSICTLSRCTFWLPSVTVEGRWIITCATGLHATVSAPTIATEAAEPARLCTSARIRTPSRDARRSTLYISNPAKTEPPGELISSVNSSSAGFSAMAWRMSAGQTAESPHQRRTGASSSATMRPFKLYRIFAPSFYRLSSTSKLPNLNGIASSLRVFFSNFAR